LIGANGLLTIAEQEVPSGLAALLIASVPLWVVVLRRAAGDRVSRASIGAVVLGFAGVALLMRPGDAWDGASLLAVAGVLLAAALWAPARSPRLG
jgi:drug/metabolite transporter (DMT)-like permease